MAELFMGNWSISIQGVGCHHNNSNPTDANLMTIEFIRKLREAGHHIDHATFTYGAQDYEVVNAIKGSLAPEPGPPVAVPPPEGWPTASLPLA